MCAAEEGGDECYPARVHATLDLLDRHLATMKDQLTPKPAAGRAPPKKVVGCSFPCQISVDRHSACMLAWLPGAHTL